MAGERPHPRPAARRAERLPRGAVCALALLGLPPVLLPGCGGDGDDEQLGGGDGAVSLSVFDGCENEFHGSCDVLDAECQSRVFSTARCLRHQPDATLPLVRVISQQELLSELMAEGEEADPGSPADAAADAALLHAIELLGLAQPGELSAESYARVFVDTVPAFYSDVDGVVTLIEDASGDASGKTLTLFHELVHALQDQDQSLAALDTEETQSFDPYLAALSVVEGEAEMLESFVAAAGWGFERDPDFRSAFTSWLPSAEAAFAEQSPFLVSPRYFPYSYGARFVFDVFSSAGMAGVRQLFDAPPPSVLPMLLNEGGPVAALPEPLDSAEPSALPGFTRHEPDRFGPWVFQKFLEMVVPDALDVGLPSHWRGDRFLVWSSDEQGVAAAWTVRLDTEAAARELFTHAEAVTLRGAPSRNAFCVRAGREVTIGATDGADTRADWAAAISGGL
jgi:hypothetical protein